MAACLILRAPVKIHNDIAAVLVAADVKPVRISLAGIGEGVEVRNAAGRIDALKFCAEAILCLLYTSDAADEL